MPDLSPEARARVEAAVRDVVECNHAAGVTGYKSDYDESTRAHAALLATVEAVVGEARRAPLWVVLDVCEEAYMAGEEFHGVFASELAAKNSAAGMVDGGEWRQVGDEWQIATHGGYVCVRPVTVEPAPAARPSAPEVGHG